MFLLQFRCCLSIEFWLLTVTSREQPKSALYLRLKIIKRGDPLGFVKLQLVAKYEKKIKGGPLGDLKKTWVWEIKMRFLNSVTVPKNVKGGPFGVFWDPLCCKISKQTKGRPFGGIQKTSKNVALCRKKSELKSLRVVLRFRSSERECQE